MKERILVVFPHPDDEAFGTAGLLAMKTKEGVPITYVCATLGEMGRNMGNPFFANRETLPEIRRKEIHDACKVLGIEDLRLLGLRDKTLEFEDLDVLSDRIEEIIHEVKPTLVITFYPGYAVHPDHDACGEATINAVKRLPEDSRPIIYCKAFSNNTVRDLGEPDIVFDVSEVFSTKLAAIAAHKSQTEGLIKSLNDKIHDINDEALLWLKEEGYYIYK
ncbi:bacillithiol biosynthesis deacetylase BshB2 [Bacillus sp. PS06]|uniref:bacillithiol biosynthesis deacetylase BshB2 n=1 Tax=Bacillus sp. PS06 TaxID=2764176 RepID=UPI00177F1873|nr:bacillithiol biosynthesis deacetylase BshB2 [Bacillus sp. PS06]MBD8068026.1 bacillithiol biosynthesis deacetylase BshB2 [Bacillus sp. PS06]